MRVGCGLFMLLIAATLGWFAFNWGHKAKQANGVMNLLTNEKQISEDVSLRYGVGAGIFGVLALIVLASGSSTPSVQHPVPAQQPQRRDPGPSNVEARLRNLRDLLDKRLISEEEYGRRRRAILDEV